jgi:hypothetical protein
MHVPFTQYKAWPVVVGLITVTLCVCVCVCLHTHSDINKTQILKGLATGNIYGA